MNFSNKHLSYLFVLTLLVLVWACQESIPETIEEDKTGQLSANTNIANLLGRVALKDGSKDNIIDKANNITIVLPITVIVNGIEINIVTEDDYQLVENAIEAFSDDDDDVNIVFPITIILSDHTQVMVTDQDDFDDYVAESTSENELDEDIECIDFKFPITFEALGVNGTIPITLVITNDAELFELIDNLEDYASVNFNFPITLITYDGVQITVSNIEALESVLEDNRDSCDEDDDFDFDDDDEEVLIGFLTSGNWIIDEYVFNDEDFTEDYEGYVFTFNSSMVVNANNGTTTVSGSWAIDSTDPNDLLVVLDFGAVTPFDILNESWKISESESDMLDLEIGSESAGDLKTLILEKREP